MLEDFVEMTGRTFTQFGVQFKSAVQRFRQYLVATKQQQQQDVWSSDDLSICQQINKLASTTKGVKKIAPFMEYKQVK